MATLQTTRLGYATGTSPRGLPWESLATRIRAFFRKRFQDHRAWPVITRLEATAMSDHELRDIGLRRADVESGLHSEALTVYALAEVARFDHF